MTFLLFFILIKKHVIISLTILLFFSFAPIYGEIILEDHRIIGDLLISSDSDIFFFEMDEEIKSKYWIKDTKIYTLDNSQTRLISDDFFAYPTELNEYQDHLVFATLSEECLENIMCDFQDIILMSKKDGSYKKIISHMKSAIHLYVVNNILYVSESNGKIWKYSLDGNNATLLYHGDHIIMDIAAGTESIFWIEEINDQNSQIVTLENGKNLQIIAKNLHTPHNLIVIDDNPIWNEIQFKTNQNDKLGEHTVIQTHDGEQLQTLAEFENKTFMSTADRNTFGPYKTAGSYLFLANNTSNEKNIHLLDLKNDENYLLKNVSYDINYFRNNANNLYVIGNIDGDFLVDRITLPVTVPEFPLSMIVLVSGFILVLTVFTRQPFQN